MVVNRTDSTNRAAAAQRAAETQRSNEAAAPQAAQAAQRPETAASSASTAAADRFNAASRPQNVAGAGNAAEAGVALREQRRARRASANGSSQVIGRPLTQVHDLNSPAAQKSIDATNEALGTKFGTGRGIAGPGVTGSGFEPNQVISDPVTGGSHVRMDQTHNGVKVFGQQVISHLNSDGKVTGMTGRPVEGIPTEVGRREPKLTPDQAVQSALKAQGVEGADNPPRAERVIVQDDNGKFHDAYHVQVERFFDNMAPGELPSRMNHMVDANTGEAIVAPFNNLGGIHLQPPGDGHDHHDHGVAGAKTAELKGSAAPGEAIPDQGEITSKITIPEGGSIEDLKVNVDIDHSYSGDLKLTLTGPDGTSVNLRDRTGGSSDNVKEGYDLSAFNGKDAAGDWTLTVSDNAAADIGVLNSWDMDIKVAKPDAPTEVSKTSAPNAAIKDNKTLTDKITVGEDFKIEDFKFNANIDHTYQGDLTVKLTSPSGTEHVLHNREGGSKDNLNFDNVDLSEVFKGESLAGDWTLEVKDSARLDQGTLKDWGFTAKGVGDGGGGGPVDPPPPAGGADDASLFSGNVDLSTSQNADGTYRLEDTTRGNGVSTYDAQNTRPRNGSRTQFTDNDNRWGQEGDSPEAKAAIDAHYGAQNMYDFLRDVVGRDSIDGQGFELKSQVHVNSNYVNAFWDGAQMYYGDGDGRTANELTTLDIAAHEIGHGFISSTSNLTYRNESGALNESMADIFGIAAEFYAAETNPAVEPDFMLGEDTWTPATPGDALRYMDTPARGDQPDHYSNKYTGSGDNGGVHINSGIPNNAWYLMANGGTNPTSGDGVSSSDALGIQEATKLFSRASELYWGPSTNFAQGSAGVIQAAKDIYGDNAPQVDVVRQAWAAVGVEPSES